MSYDIRLRVKAEGTTDCYPEVARPEYDSPTYNLGPMFRACMGWDYKQSDNYPCTDVIKYVERGIYELRTKRGEYIKYNSPNGWGTIDGAISALESLRNCIYETAEYIPMSALYVSW